MDSHYRVEDVQSSRDDDSHSHDSGSFDEGMRLTVAEAKGILRDILTLCERQPRKRRLAEERAKAKGDPRAAMLCVVPMVVEVAEEALAKRNKNKQPTSGRPAARPAAATAVGIIASMRQEEVKAAGTAAVGAPLLAAFLREAQFLVGSDSSGNMKRDVKALRALLSPS